MLSRPGAPPRPGGSGRRSTLGTAVAAVTGLVLVVGPAVADPAPADSVRDRQRAVRQQLDDLRETLEGTSADLVNAAVTLQRSRSQLVDARSALGAADEALAGARRRDAELAAQLAVAMADEAKAGRELGARRRAEVRTRGRIGAIARDAYLGSGLSGLAVALDAQSPDQFAEQASAADTALRVQNGTIARLGVQQADLRAQQARLGAARDQVGALKRRSAQVVAARRAAEAVAASAERQIATIVGTQNRALAVIRVRKAAEQARVDQLQHQQDQLQAILVARARADAARASRRPAASSSGWADPGGGVLSRPMNAPITSGFGLRFHPILHIWRLHAGVDFGAPCGTPVHAAADGTVVRAGWAGGFGNQLVIDHGMVRGVVLASSYNHLSRILAGSGQVRRGEIVAYSGTTGLSTGCHLHFEVYVNGVHVNPMTWL